MFEEQKCAWIVLESSVSNTEINGLHDVILTAKLLCTATGKHAGIVDEGLDPYTTYGETFGVEVSFEPPTPENFTDLSSITKETILDWAFAIIDKEEIEQLTIAGLNEKWKFLFEEPASRTVNFNTYEE